MDPQNATKAWLNKGSILWSHNRLNESLIAFDQALSLDQNISEAWFTRGLILKDLGRYNESIQAFETAYQLNPDDSNYKMYRDRYNNQSMMPTGKRTLLPLSSPIIILGILITLGLIWRKR